MLDNFYIVSLGLWVFILVMLINPELYHLRISQKFTLIGASYNFKCTIYQNLILKGNVNAFLTLKHV